MASGDFLDLYSKAIYSSRRDTADNCDVARAKEAVNEALQAISFTGDPWTWLEKEGQITLTAGSDTYTMAGIGTALGTDVAEIMTLVRDDTSEGYGLEAMSWGSLEELSSSTQDGESSGEPVFWAAWDSRIRLFPKPDAAYKLGVFYRAYQSELAADGDVPLLPLEWRARLVVPYAASILLRQEGGGEAGSEADRFQMLFERALRECRTALGTARSSTMRLVSAQGIRDPNSGWSYLSSGWV